MCKVSIIIPIYKVDEKFLRKCIESAIGQTLKDIEIILIDDGSPDNCGQICDKYAKEDERIIVIHQKNKGLCGARNAGVKKATGEWICFIDGDDWIENQMCETLYNYSKNNDLEVIICAITRDYGHKICKYDYSRFEDKKVYENEECKYLQKEMLDHSARISGVYAKLIKRDVLLKYNIFHNESLRQGAEGIEFNLRLFENVKKVLFVKEYFYHYMYNSESISSSHNEENHMYVLKCFKEIKKEINEFENKEELLEKFYIRMLYVIVTTAISGYFNPENKEKFKIKKKKYMQYLKDPLIEETFEKANLKKLDKKRFIIIKLIQFRCYRVIDILAKVRKKQKQN